MGEGEADGVNGGYRLRAALAVWIALMAVSIEMMGMTVALPAIAAGLHVPPAATTWVIKAYLLGILLTLLPISALGERIGCRRVYQAGLALYAVAGLSCLAAPTMSWLILFRGFQGVGMAGIVGVNGALVRYIFPKERLTHAFATNALIVSGFGAAGPSFASLMIALGSWRWMFLLSPPLCLVSLALGFSALPDNPRSERYDGLSALLYSATIAGIAIGAGAFGETPSAALAILAATAVIAILLFRRSLLSSRPLVPIDLLRSRIFTVSVLTSIGAYTAQTLSFVTLPFLLVRGMHWLETDIGPLMMSWPIAIACAAPIAGRLAARIPISALAGIGLTILMAGLAMVLLIPMHPAFADIAWRLAVCGFGFGFFQAPNNHLVLTSAPFERAGAAAGMQAIARHIGQVTGASIAALAFTLRPDRPLAGLAAATMISGVSAVLSFSRRFVDRPAIPATAA